MSADLAANAIGSAGFTSNSSFPTSREGYRAMDERRAIETLLVP